MQIKMKWTVWLLVVLSKHESQRRVEKIDNQRAMVQKAIGEDRTEKKKRGEERRKWQRRSGRNQSENDPVVKKVVENTDWDGDVDQKWA